MRRIGRWMLNALTVLSLLLCVAAMTGCAAHHIPTQPDNIIRPGMRLEVSIHINPEPSIKLVTVDPSGQIELPLFGKLKAAGLTCAEVEVEINRAYLDSGGGKPLDWSVRIIGFEPGKERTPHPNPLP